MRCAPFLLLAIVLSCTAFAWDNGELGVTFKHSPIIALVQVRESTFPIGGYRSIEDQIRSSRASATLVVIASWKGPYHSGATLRAVQPPVCAGYPCITYPFQVGEIVLVFASECREPISPEPLSVVKEPELRSLMTELYKLSLGEQGANNLFGIPCGPK